jgi:hypothetical protein
MESHSAFTVRKWPNGQADRRGQKFYKLKIPYIYQMKSAYLVNSLFVLLVSSGVGLCKSGSDDFMADPMRIPLTSTECKDSDSGPEHSYKKSPQGNLRQPY